MLYLERPAPTMPWADVLSCRRSFQCNRLLKWCPAPDCHHVVKVQYPDAKPVRCKCGRQFWWEPLRFRWRMIWRMICVECELLEILKKINEFWWMNSSAVCSFNCGENWHDPVKCKVGNPCNKPIRSTLTYWPIIQYKEFPIVSLSKRYDFLSCIVAEEMDQEMWWWQWNFELDCSKH